MLGHVRHHPPGGVGGCGGADIGDEVEQRAVLLVADRAHHRCLARSDGPDQGLVGERQQILDRAAAPGDDDHLHGPVRVEAVQRVGYLRDGVRALDRDLLDPELDSWPPRRRVAPHIALGRRIASADQADGGGQKGQRPHAFGREQALRGQ